MRIIVLAACLGTLGVQQTALARDNGGVQEFFAREFGFGTPEPSQASPVWSEEDPYDRPLVVRPRHRPRATRAATATVVKGPTPKVSIYEDKTLRRGDAVMTANGMRVFRGSATMPYRDSDFVPVAQGDGLSRDVAKTLLAMDRVPRG